MRLSFTNLLWWVSSDYIQYNDDESKIDAQIELVQEIIKDWEWVIWYPNKDSLLKSYSEGRFYC